MGIIDPMAVTSVATTGVLEFSGAHTFWLMMVGAMAGSALGILVAVVHPLRSLSLLPRPRHKPLLAAGAGRVR